MTADHGIETGDVIYLAGVGLPTWNTTSQLAGFVTLESSQAFFAIVDGNTGIGHQLAGSELR